MFLGLQEFLDLSPLGFLDSTLVPEPIEEHIFNLAASISLSDNVQVLLGHLAGDLLRVVWEHLHIGENSCLVLLLSDTVVKSPDDHNAKNEQYAQHRSETHAHLIE